MFNNISILQKTFLGNTVKDYLISLLIFLIGIFILYLVKNIMLKQIKKFAEKTTTKIDDFMLKFFSKIIIPILYFSAVYAAVKNLQLSPEVTKILTSCWVILLSIQRIRLILALSVYSTEKLLLSKERKIGISPEKSKTIISILKVIIWGLGVVFILDNLGFNISTVIAGLGIGGVAVALAAQTILGDLFNYFVIFFDKPFEIGDFIIIDDYLGAIEHIGIKTTRVRSLGGEQLVFSNSDLTSSRVRNYKRMDKRRVLFTIGVIYQTSLEKMKKIPGLISDIIKSIEDTVFDRAHFQSFGDFSLNIEVVYYVMGGDYNKYMDIQQEINLKIKESFEKEGIEFAYPTQMVYMEKISPIPIKEKK